MKVLLLINPEYVEKILNGAKKFKFRKGIFEKPDAKSVVIYSAMSVGRVVAEFDIADVIENKPSIAWGKTSQYAGISKQFFDSYFHDKGKAFAIEIGNLKIYGQPLHLSSLGDNVTTP